MDERRVLIVGGGAAGFFAAIACAEARRGCRVRVVEKSPGFLAKVRISGGGRCNVTHHCFEARDLCTFYPRGERALAGPFRRFGPRETVAWFEKRGVKLKAEADGRMFPVTDTSRTVVDCLVRSARSAGVEMVAGRGVERLARESEAGFEVAFTDGSQERWDRVMLATGGCRVAAAGQLATGLGHSLEAPVPSLFTFHIVAPWLRELAGNSLEDVEVAVPAAGLKERGALLVTHAGLSGPAVLRLSAWGARKLHGMNYTFPLLVNWLPGLDFDGLTREIQARQTGQAARLVINGPIAPLTSRLWEQLVLQAGVGAGVRWAELSRAGRHALVQQLSRTEFTVCGKTLNQDEFVTCGGVPLSEVNFKTMESRVCRGLYLGGELLDIDGVTGGFNFQAAWTTGWIAGNAMAE